jgi:hypothetical protein
MGNGLSCGLFAVICLVGINLLILAIIGWLLGIEEWSEDTGVLVEIFAAPASIGVAVFLSLQVFPWDRDPTRTKFIPGVLIGGILG